MKKIVKIMSIFLALFMIVVSTNIYGASLDDVQVTISKEKVYPGDNVTVEIEFGVELGSYTVDVAYDSNVLEYVSAENGTATDDGTRVRVVYFDSEGGTGLEGSESVTFKAKSGITASNPTNFSVTLTGLAGETPADTYDEITTPIVKTLMVEPLYEEYEIALSYTDDIKIDEEKDMKITISSPMGKNYAHTRLIATVVTPEDGTVRLLAKDSENLEHDIIQSGWGDASGDPLGGEDVLKEILARGIFSKAGNYSITLKVIDRDDSDEVIATKSFDITVKGTSTTGGEETGTGTGNGTTGNETGNENDTKPDIEKTDVTTGGETQKTDNSKALPQTGTVAYIAIIPIVFALAISYVYLRKKK